MAIQGTALFGTLLLGCTFICEAFDRQSPSDIRIKGKKVKQRPLPGCTATWAESRTFRTSRKNKQRGDRDDAKQGRAGT